MAATTPGKPTFPHVLAHTKSPAPGVPGVRSPTSATPMRRGKPPHPTLSGTRAFPVPAAAGAPTHARTTAPAEHGTYLRRTRTGTRVPPVARATPGTPTAVPTAPFPRSARVTPGT